MRFFITLVFLTALLSAPSGADAQIYRYVMEDGTVMFTTEPQSGDDPTDIIGEAAPSQSRSERFIPTPPDRPNPNPSREQSAFDELIAEAAEAYSIPFAFIKAVIRVESAFDPHAVSHAGAQGLMQLMPATAESLNCEDPFDPRDNVMAGTQFLSVLSNRYNGDINLTLAAYNAGSGTVSRYDGIPYEATRRYIERVYQYYLEYLDVE
ncbi:MAG: soluble lytic murein transglycosylase-like protein [Bradymonadia bacterium]|jgi:soluble lytic murein transglycosylase-like protein